MLTMALGFLKNWKVIAIGIVVLAIAGLAYWGIPAVFGAYQQHKWDEERAALTEDIKRLEAENVQKQLDVAKAQNDRKTALEKANFWKAQAEAELKNRQQLLAQLATIEQRLRQVKEEVANVPTEQLRPRIRASLGVLGLSVDRPSGGGPSAPAVGK